MAAYRTRYRTAKPDEVARHSNNEKLRWGQTWFSVFKCYNFAQLHSAVFQLESVLARKPRVKFPGAIYHVVTRGDGRQLLFHDDRHYQRFTEGKAPRDTHKLEVILPSLTPLVFERFLA